MKTFEDFKNFIKDKDYLKMKVKNSQTTWQELYERYNLYGPDDEIFLNKEKDNSKTNQKEDSLSSFINMISGIDVDKISDGLNGMKKILNILSELSVDEAATFTRRKSEQPYKRDDD